MEHRRDEGLFGSSIAMRIAVLIKELL